MAFLNMLARRGISRWWKNMAGIGFILALVLLICAGNSPAQTTPNKEHQLKAVFLFNFAQFVDWPAEAFTTNQTPLAPLVIGILGDDPFGTYLDELVRGEKVNNRPLVIERYQRVEDIKTCHVLFISKSENSKMDKVLAGLKGRSVLTVGETEEFAQRGGMIQFFTEKGKIRLKINLQAAKSGSLTISSKLLRPAEIVAGGKE